MIGHQDRLGRVNSMAAEEKVKGGNSKEISQPTHLESDLKERSNNIKNVCEENKAELLWQPDNFQMKLRNHIWDFTHGLVYCPIAKVASTTWFFNFLKIVNINMQGLQALQKSRVVVTGNMSFVRKNQENQITKIKSRNILRNITTLAGKWKFEELKKVWSLTMEALNGAFFQTLVI